MARNQHLHRLENVCNVEKVRMYRERGKHGMNSKSRQVFMDCLSEFLENDEDNERYNGILEIADEYAESEACMEKARIGREVKKTFERNGVSYGKEHGGFAAEIAAIFDGEVANE